MEDVKVTHIKAAIKTKGRYNIFLDGKYSFSLTENQLLDLGMKIGREVTNDELEKFKDESEFGKAYARALDLIARRPRSEKEIREYARRKKWQPEWADKIIAKLKDLHYIDDTSFARTWVSSRAHLKQVSKKKLRLELMQKGILSDVIDSTIEDSDEYDEKESLRRLIRKKHARYEDAQKFMMYLARQGFRFDDIKQVLEEEGITYS